jgi:uncharacterized protein
MVMQIKIKVTPRAKQNRILGWQGNVLRVHIMAPPVDGRANEALIKFLADEWGVAKSNVKIIRGQAGREKILEIPEGLAPLQSKLI